MIKKHDRTGAGDLREINDGADSVNIDRATAEREGHAKSDAYLNCPETRARVDAFERDVDRIAQRALGERSGG